MDPYSQPQPPLQPPQQTPLEYLDAISVSNHSQTMSPIKLWSIIGGALIALVIIVITIVSLSGGNGASERYTALQQRMEQLNTLTKNESKNLQSSSLRALNGTTVSILNTSYQESMSHLSTLGIKKYAPPKKGASLLTEFATLTTKLDDARLNNMLDQVYAREVAYQLAQVEAEVVSVYNFTKSKSVKDYLTTVDKNITPLITQFGDFNNSQS